MTSIVLEFPSAYPGFYDFINRDEFRLFIAGDYSVMTRQPSSIGSSTSRRVSGGSNLRELSPVNAPMRDIGYSQSPIEQGSNCKGSDSGGESEGES